MNNKKFSLIAIILMLSVCLGCFASCTEGFAETTETQSGCIETTIGSAETSHAETVDSSAVIDSTEKSETDSVETEKSETDSVGTDSRETEIAETTKAESESDEMFTTASPEESSEEPDQPPREFDETLELNYNGSNSDIITLGGALSGKVQSYYKDGSGDVFVMENANTVINYNMSTALGCLVGSITDKNGNAYIENTMDVFVQMTDGKKYYSSDSFVSPSMNIYRLGYYYYENRIEGQLFVGEGSDTVGKDIKHYDMSKLVNVEQIGRDGRVAYYKITERRDPQMYLPGINFNASEYSYLEVTMKADKGIREELELYIWAGSYEHYSSEQKLDYKICVDGEYHTYIIPMSAVPDYTGRVKGIRLDVNGEAGSTFEIKSIRAISFGEGTPQDISMQRSFLTYSDKIHHIAQIAAARETGNISLVGVETKIPVDSIEGMIIKDRRGWHYYAEDKIAWSYVEYVGFIIKGAGVFGVILPSGDSGESLRLERDESGENYLLQVRMAPNDQTIKPSVKGSGNSNDLFIGYRVYTDSETTFDRFVYEAECERNPLGEENFLIDAKKSGGASFEGYDALRGYYKFNIDLAGGFNGPFYDYPNRHFGVRFTAIGDGKNRNCYIVGYTADGALECSAILDERSMLLPVPVQVGKNFKGDGENTIYNIDDFAYGESLIPFSIPANSSETYTMLHLYQNWGKLPLKQLSSIQFYSPYYHLSVGTSETNCIVPFSAYGLALTDFRANSAPFWDNQPQHNSCGSHSFALYTDSEGYKVTAIHKGSLIDSYGPTYAEMTDYFESGDGKYKFTYTHMELPQTDENRTFYQIKIEFSEDTRFESFKDSFEIYRLGSADPTGKYQKIGYLNSDNVCSVTTANLERGTVNEYLLGDECPYFTYFYMDNPTHVGVMGYSNPAFLVYRYDVTVGGEEQDAAFLLKDNAEYLTLTLNLGEVEFKAGDSIVIDGILLPWGSQELDPPQDPADRDPDKTYYDTVINGATGELYMDKNVRDVRADSLLNPMTLVALENCERLDSFFLPKGKTTDGKSATFTVSGGANNIAVRIYGFDTLTVPVIEEYIDGEWQIVDVSSSGTPDKRGYGYLYDGYTVYRDADGSYSYAFAFDIGEGAERTFRVTAEGEFEGFDEVDPYEDLPLNVYISAENMASLGADLDMLGLGGGYDVNVKDGYFRFYGNGKKEVYLIPYKESSLYPTTGQYAVLKYRVPTTNSTSFYGFDVFASTTKSWPEGVDDFYNSRRTIVEDGEWHVLIIDLSSVPSVVASDDGSYTLKYIRFDIMNSSNPIAKTDYIDIAYFGISDSLEDICALEGGMESLTLSQDGMVKYIDPGSGEITIPPEEIKPDTGLDLYITHMELDAALTFYTDKKLFPKDFFVRYTGRGQSEAFVYPYMDASGSAVTGRYAVFKYRIPTEAEGTLEKFEVYASTVHGEAVYGSSIEFGGIVADGEWHVMIIDLSAIDSFLPDENGDYRAKHLRVDVINKKLDSSFFIDFSYVAMHHSLDEIMAFLGEDEDVTYIAKQEEVDIDLNLVVSANDLSSCLTFYCDKAVAVDGSYIRYTGKGKGDAFVYAYMDAKAPIAAGQYAVIKYRIPEGSVGNLTSFEIFASTTLSEAVAGSNIRAAGIVADGEWHIMIIDLSGLATYTKNADGTYNPKHLRVDVIDQKNDSSFFIDVAYVAMHDSLDGILGECGEDAHVTLVNLDASYTVIQNGKNN